MSKGWECPKCGAVYAPWVFACQHCNLRAIAFTTTAGGYGKPKQEQKP